MRRALETATSATSRPLAGRTLVSPLVALGGTAATQKPFTVLEPFKLLLRPLPERQRR